MFRWLRSKITAATAATPPEPPDGFTIQQEAKLIEQEHRRIQQLYNLWTYGLIQDAADPRRDAARKALLWGMLTTAGRVGAIGIIPAAIGLYLAYKANTLVENQNKLIQTQNELSEANRRALASGEMTAIAERLTELKFNEDDEAKYKTDALAQRIIAFSRSLRPYTFLEWKGQQVATTSTPISPERSQLLVLLLGITNAAFSDKDREAMRVANEGDVHSPVIEDADVKKKVERIKEFLESILSSGDFQYADLQSADLSFPPIVIKGMNWSFGNLGKAQLHGGIFSTHGFGDVNLKGARISYGHWDWTPAMNVNAEEAQFYSLKWKTVMWENVAANGAIFDRVDADDCNFKDVSFVNAIFRNCKISKTTFEKCKFSGCTLPNAEDFSETVFNACDLAGAIVPSSNWLEQVGVKLLQWKTVPTGKDTWLIVKK